jgi:hypothetical protein
MKTGFFSFLRDHTGKISHARVAGILCLLWAFYLSRLTIIGDKLDSISLTLIIIFILGCFAPKAIQKIAEMKLKDLIKK